MKVEERMEWCGHKQRNQTGAGRDMEGFLPDPPEGVWPTKTAVELLISTTMTEFISIVLNLQICGNLLHQPQDTNTMPVSSTIPSQYLCEFFI